MALIEKLTAIGDAIREKGGTTELLTLDEMPVAIAAIQSGGGSGGDFEPVILTGITKQMFKDDLSTGCYTTMLEKSDVLFETENITTADEMFYGNTKVTKIPLAINFQKDGNISGMNMFYQNTALTSIGTINNGYLFNNMFNYCSSLEELPKFENIVSGKGTLYYTFAGCEKLRSIPSEVLSSVNGGSSGAEYNLAFNNCKSLREINGIGIITTDSAPSFANAFKDLWKCKDITFATKEDGTPIECSWSQVIIAMTGRIGYANGTTFADADKRIKSETTYQELKNDPDAWTNLATYAFYNHDSVVKTLASLPDTSIGGTVTSGTNVIQFTGDNGSATDGGAINTLTEEEIAVATAKNWGVALY